MAIIPYIDHFFCNATPQAYLIFKKPFNDSKKAQLGQGLILNIVPKL